MSERSGPRKNTIEVGDGLGQLSDTGGIANGDGDAKSRPSDIENEDGVAQRSSGPETAARRVVEEESACIEEVEEKKNAQERITQVRGLWPSACLPKDFQETDGTSMQPSSEASSPMMVTDVVETGNVSSSSALGSSVVNTQCTIKLRETSIRASQSSSWMKATTKVELGSATSTSVANLSASLSNAPPSDNHGPSSSQSTTFNMKPKGATCFGDIELEIVESDSEQEEVGDDVKDWCANLRNALEELEQEEVAKQQRKLKNELKKLKHKEKRQENRDFVLAQSLTCTRRHASAKRKATNTLAKKLTPTNTPAKQLIPTNTPAKNLAPTTALNSSSGCKLESSKNFEKNQDTNSTNDDSTSVDDNEWQLEDPVDLLNPDMATGRVGDDEWIVEKITDYVVVENEGKRKIMYNTKWLGWDEKFNSWEPAHHFKNKKIIQDFWKEKQNISDGLNAPFELEETSTNPSRDKFYFLDRDQM